jgi:acetyl esterase/lipase
MQRSDWLSRSKVTALVCAGVTALVILNAYFNDRKPVTVTYNEEQTHQPALKMQIYPTEADGDNHPAVLFFHGGGWITGSPDQFKWFAEKFAACGIVSALVEYRVHSRHGTLPDSAVDDAYNAYQWMYRHHAQFGVKAAHIALVGGSAGGHIAAASALSYPYGASSNYEGSNTTPPFALGLLNPVLELTVAKKSQGYTQEELKLIEALGPTKTTSLSLGSKLERTDIPTQIIYGSLDPLLPTAYEVLLSQAENPRAPLELLVASGENHGFFNYEPWRTRVAGSLLAFLRAHGAAVDCKLAMNGQSKLENARENGA